MSKIVYDANGKQIDIVLKEDIEILKNRFTSYDIYSEFNTTDPVEGFKKIYTRIPVSRLPLFVELDCGANYNAIVNKMSNNYLSAIIFGYSMANMKFIRFVNGTWYS